ncbi:MAG TPA: endonuclease III [Candidatus Baltobacteraceae bacterium]|nr:endonuclease III [Candidatus Baltobacteraceae bacterium]
MNSAAVPKIPFPLRKVSKDVGEKELAILERAYPHAETALHYTNPFELIVAVILSAQCTDARVNMTTPVLFEKYPTPQKLAKAKSEDIERIIKSCGFFRMKTRSIINCAKALVEQYGGEVPREREQLEELAGVGRKTASVVMSVAFGEAAIAVDTHVFRVAHRLGLTLGKTPRDVENDLEALVPRDKWRHAHHWLILHGREVCKAPVPQCGRCPVKDLCPTPKIVAKTLGVRTLPGAVDAAVRRPARSASARKKA